jgi:hypothetical protein
MGNGLVFAFIIEENSDGRYTVFIPSVPSVVVGSVYIFPRERVHLLNASFARGFQVLSRQGSGAQLWPPPVSRRCRTARWIQSRRPTLGKGRDARRTSLLQLHRPTTRQHRKSEGIDPVILQQLRAEAGEGAGPA